MKTMMKTLSTLLLAFGLIFWISDESADAKRVKRSAIGKSSYITFTGGFNKKRKYRKVARRNISQTRRRIASSRVQIRISIASQSMTVVQGGRQVGSWRVSTGKSGFATPRGNFRVGRMHRTYFSRKYYNSPMPYSMFFYGGVAIHGTNYLGSLGRPASHGCVRLHPGNAAKLFALVQRYGGSVQVY
jgi:lipoprotein-anchoring transpeptidase ErfK/SrfK